MKQKTEVSIQLKNLREEL
ncbi:uncharacterized, partial [Tachysurus ichikawai]